LITFDEPSPAQITRCDDGNVNWDMNRLVLIICLSAFLALPLSAQFSAVGSVNPDAGTDVATDATGNVYVAMTFQGTIDFDKGPAENIRFSIGDTTDPTAVDVAIVKYSPDLVLQWVVTFGSPGPDVIHGMQIAPNGDVVVVGAIGGTVYDLDPSDTVTSLFGHAGRDAFIARYSSDGHFRWARSFGDAEADASNEDLQEDAFDLSIDAKNNVYITGGFNGVIDLDPDTDSTSSVFTSTKSSKDVWFASYDANGAYRWGRRVGGIGRDEGHGIRMHDGDVVISGFFSNAIDMDLSANVRECISNGGWDAFIARYDDTLALRWTTSFGAPTFDDQVCSGGLDVSNSGNASITGVFGGSIDLDRGPAVVRLTSKGLGDVFYVQYAPDSTILQSYNVGGAGNDRPEQLLQDPEGNVFIAGAFQSVADFDPGSGVLSLQAGGTGGAYNSFVAKYSRDGAVRWATAFGAVLSGDAFVTKASGLAIDDINGVWVVGQFFDAIDIDPGSTQFYLRSAGSSDAFVLHYEPNGGLNIGQMTSVHVDEVATERTLAAIRRGECDYLVYSIEGKTIDATLQQLQHGIYYIVVRTERSAITIPVMIR